MKFVVNRSAGAKIEGGPLVELRPLVRLRWLKDSSSDPVIAFKSLALGTAWLAGCGMDTDCELRDIAAMDDDLRREIEASGILFFVSDDQVAAFITDRIEFMERVRLVSYREARSTI